MGNNRVWILGAGFSRSLGGPLIQDLLAWRPDSIIKSILPGLYHGQSDVLAAESATVRGFCAYGIAERYWEHAEEFLAAVETAALDEQSYAGKLIRGMLKGTAVWPRSIIKASNLRNIPSSLPPYTETPGPFREFNSITDLLNAARRAVVADCWMFLQGSQSELVSSPRVSERWEPYVTWARLLDDSNTIITFNYDEVPEFLIGDEKQNKLRVIRPTRVPEYRSNPTNIVPVIKMHGSTSWILTDEGVPDTLSKLGDIPRCLTDPAIEPLVGMPGPTKLAHSTDHFAALWTLALDSIKLAEEIVFIGYRFPPTDFYAQAQLLSAIVEKPSAVRMEVILGPPSVASDRMRELFVNKRPHVLPLNCVDYLLRFISLNPPPNS